MKEVFDKYFKRLVSFCNGIIKSKEDAEDISMNVFIELFRRYDAFETEQKMKAFLFLSAKRRCINYIRESKRTTPINTTDEFIDNAEINSILIDELDKLINKEVSKLPWRQRQIAEMIIFGLTEDEIAKELKVSKKVVFNLKYILSATLKLKLKNYIKMSP